jgi:hypothetical protein
MKVWWPRFHQLEPDGQLVKAGAGGPNSRIVKPGSCLPGSGRDTSPPWIVVRRVADHCGVYED